MPSKFEFREELRDRLRRAEGRGAKSIEINAGELHRSLGGYPEGPHQMPSLCDVMHEEQDEADEIVRSPPKGRGASLTIRYKLPRPVVSEEVARKEVTPSPKKTSRLQTHPVVHPAKPAPTPTTSTKSASPAGMLIAVDELLRSLARRRPIFHSEADFQHELAWEIRHQAPHLTTLLERPFPGRASGAIDIVLTDGKTSHALELKYLTRSCRATVAGEEFSLKRQGAHDVRRYDVCKDVSRMEEFCRRPDTAASVIVLSNDPAYWGGGSSSGTCAEAFAICEDRDLSGLLAWAEHTGAGTMKSRENAVAVDGRYRLAWRDYSNVGESGGRFRYLHLVVGGVGGGETPSDAVSM